MSMRSELYSFARAVLYTASHPFSSLMEYAVRNNSTTWAWLASFGANPNQIYTDGSGDSYLHRVRSLEIAKILKDSGATIVLNAEGVSPLHNILQASYLHTNTPTMAFEITKLLLEIGANPNQQMMNSGRTPLHLAVSLRGCGVAGVNVLLLVQLLLSKDADANLQTRSTINGAFDNKTALHELLEIIFTKSYGDYRDAEDMRILQSLIDAPNSRCKDIADAEGKRPVDIFADYLSERNPTSGNRWVPMNDDIASALLGANAFTPNLFMPRGFAVSFVNRIRFVHYVAAKCVASVVNMFLTDHNKHDCDSSGKTPLHYAAALANTDGVDALLAKNADVNAVDHNRRLPIDYAVANGTAAGVAIADRLFGLMQPMALIAEATARKILTGKINPDIGGETPEHWYRLVPIHERQATETTILHFAAQFGDQAAIEYAVEKMGSAAVNTPDHNGRTPLHYAAASGNLLAMQALIAAGADLNAIDNEGLPVIYYAAHSTRNTDSIMRMLTENFDEPVDINKQVLLRYQTHDQVTLLHVAAQAGTPSAIEALLRHGADPAAQDRCVMAVAVRNPRVAATGLEQHSSKTPLHYAVEHKKHANAAVLAKVRGTGGTQPLADAQGFLPQQYALHHQDTEMLRLLPAIPKNWEMPGLKRHQNAQYRAATIQVDQPSQQPQKAAHYRAHRG